MDIRIGLIGPGKIAGRQLVPALRQVPGLQLWSVLSRDPGRAAAFAAEHGASSPHAAHTDLRQMLADPQLDAVIIASPDRLHAAQGIAAAQSGKHVFVEKPMVTDVAEGEQLVAACRAADVRLGVAYHLRWHAGHRALVEKIRKGVLGSLRHVRVQWTFEAPDPANWRARPEVGRWWALAAVGTHCLDLVRWVMVPQAGEVKRIKGLLAGKVHPSPHDQTSLLTLEFEDGSTAEIATSVLFNSQSRFEIFGAQGSAICEGTLGPSGAGTIRIDDQSMPFTPANPYVGELADFAAAIREHRDPEVSGVEGLRNTALLDQASRG